MNTTDDSEAIATISAGCSVRQAQEFLLASGMQLKGFGAIIEQRIGGAVATSLHGLHSHAFADHVRGVQAILANGTVVNINSSDPILRAWSGTLGTLGVVVSVTLRVWPAEFTTCVTETLNGPNVTSIIQDNLLNANLIGFQATGFLTQHTPTTSFELKTCVIATPAEVLIINNLNISLTAMPIYDGLPHALIEYFGYSALFMWSSSLHNVIFSTIAVTEQTYGVSAHTYVNPSMHNVHPDQEYAIPIKRCMEALDEFQNMTNGLYAIHIRRLVQGQTITAFAHNDSCIIGLSFLDFQHSMASKLDSDFRIAVENVVIHKYGGRGHLGKAWIGNAHALAQSHPEAAEFEAYRASVDPNELFQNAYTREMRGVGTRPFPTYPPELSQRGDRWRSVTTAAFALSCSALLIISITLCIMCVVQPMYKPLQRV
jgi:hypothetical protein